MQLTPLKNLVRIVKRANRERLRRRKAPERLAYQRWVKEEDTLTPSRLSAFQAELTALKDRPLISILMPVFNADLAWLRAAVDSVRAQIYPVWELCIADDCSTDQHLREYLTSLPASDRRIKVMFRPTNGHISACSNSALELCEGTHVALLDQDDVLPAQALLRVAQALERVPDAGMVYSDEDKIGPDGLRESPARKTAWHPGLLTPFNQISHLGVYRRDLIRSVGGFRKGFEGAQDHDLALRCSERLLPRQIVHIPEILYHWRAHMDSTASSLEAKPYALAARSKCIEEHLQRQHVRKQA